MSNPFTKTWQKRGDPSSSKRQPIRNWSGTLKRLWTYLAVFRKQLLVVLGLVCLSSLCALLGPLFIGWLLDHYVLLGQYEGLLFFLVLLFSLYTVGSASVWLQNTLMIRLAQKTIFALRKDLFHHVHALPLSYFQQKKHGDVMSRLTNDIENISATLNSSFIQILSSILTFIGILTVMLWLSPLLTVLTLTVVPAMIVGMKWITNRTGPYFKEQQRQMGEVNGFIEETISGRAVIQTFSREDEMIAAFQSKNAHLKKAGFWAQTYSGFIPKLMNLLNSISFAIIAGIGGILALRELVTIGTIVIFAEYARQFTRPLNDLANQFNTMLSAVAGAERVFDLMDQEGESDSEKAVSLATVRGEVCFQNVSFSYQKEDSGKTVSDIHFSVSPGETIALVGPTGAGKTTILQLLARFYEVDNGTISIDRHDTQQLKLANLRQHIGFVLQDTFLFEATIRENIRYGRLNATDQDIEEAARLANAHSFISQLPDQYDTLLKEGGRGISEGQKQLLAIARVILANPAILVLDEATSSIDTLTEINIQQALATLMKGRTSFIIAHRLQTIEKADRILVLQHGRIVQQGTHQALLQQDGLYRELFQKAATETG